MAYSHCPIVDVQRVYFQLGRLIFQKHAALAASNTQARPHKIAGAKSRGINKLLSMQAIANPKQRKPVLRVFMFYSQLFFAQTATVVPIAPETEFLSREMHLQRSVW